MATDEMPCPVCPALNPIATAELPCPVCPALSPIATAPVDPWLSAPALAPMAMDEMP